MASDVATPVSMREFFAAGARALVTAQLALDARAEETPSAAFAYADCRLRFPTSMSCVGRKTSSERAVVAFAPASRAAGEVSVTLRRLTEAELTTLEGRRESH
jgi:hypothetical protein